MGPAVELQADRLVIRVRLTPKAATDRIDGIEEKALRVRVRALPSEGAANAALLAFLAQALGLPKSALVLTAGAKARAKTVTVRADPGRLQQALERLRALTDAVRT